MPALVDAINADPKLALRASANPILAAEEVGVRLTERLARDAELRVRFVPNEVVELERLAGEVRRIARRPGLDLQSAADVGATLRRLGVPLPEAGDARAGRAESGAKAPTASRRTKTAVDQAVVASGETSAALLRQLEALADSHRVVPPLLAYLRLEATRPRLASREAYDRLRGGEGHLPDIELRYRLQRSAGPT